jgi:hypothetical protein
MKTYVDNVNTSMRNNVSANFPSTSYVDNVNTSMRNNVSQYVIAVNDTMRNNVSQYVIAVNNTQIANISLNNATMKTYVDNVNTSMRENVSHYVIDVNDSMRSYVDTSGSSYLFLNGTREMTGNLSVSYIFAPTSTNDLHLTGDNDHTGNTGGELNLHNSDVDGANTIELTTKYKTNAPGSVVQHKIILSVPWVNDSADIYASFNDIRLGNVSDPLYAQDAATKHYVDDANTSMKSYVDSVVVDTSVFLLLDGTRTMTGNLIFDTATGIKQRIIRGNSDDGLLQIIGATTTAKGPIINLWGADHATHPGEFGAFVPNAAKSSFVQIFKVAGVTDTPNLNMLAHNVSNMLDPVAAKDATTKSYVDTFHLDSNVEPFTGPNLYRDVKSSGLLLYGGGTTAGEGALLYLFGSDHATYPGQLNFYVPNAAKTGVSQIIRVAGNTDTPELDLVSHKIIGVLDPTLAQDAATKNYVDNVNTSMRNNVSTAIDSKSSYTLSFQGLAIASPLDSTSYVFGGTPMIPSTTTLMLSNVTVPHSGTIKTVTVNSYSSTAGSNEAWAMNLIKNGAYVATTQYIGSVSRATTTRVWTNYTINLAVTQGDTLEIRSVCPAWGTNPAALVFSGNVYIE